MSNTEFNPLLECLSCGWQGSLSDTNSAYIMYIAPCCPDCGNKDNLMQVSLYELPSSGFIRGALISTCISIAVILMYYYFN